MLLQRIVAGTKCKVEGLENLPKNGSYIIASNHQSSWETFSLLPFLDDPAIILKRELMWIPLFGWYMWKVRMIPIDRGSPLKALKKLIKEAKQKVAQGRQILIFPEGHRKEPGSKIELKPGVISLYNELNIPIVVIVHDAGLYWPKDNIRRYPGTIKVRIFPPIEAGLGKKEVAHILEKQLQDGADQLLIEASQGKNPPAMPPIAVKKLAEKGIDWQGPTRY